MNTVVRLVAATFALVGAAQLSSAQPAPAPPAPPDASAPPPPAPDGPPPDATAPPPPVTPAPTTPAPAAAPPRPGAAPALPRGPEWTSLRLLHDKGVISDAELASALRDIGVVGAGDASTLVVAKLKT